MGHREELKVTHKGGTQLYFLKKISARGESNPNVWELLGKQRGNDGPLKREKGNGVGESISEKPNMNKKNIELSHAGGRREAASPQLGERGSGDGPKYVRRAGHGAKCPVSRCDVAERIPVSLLFAMRREKR